MVHSSMRFWEEQGWIWHFVGRKGTGSVVPMVATLPASLLILIFSYIYIYERLACPKQSLVLICVELF